MVSFELIPLFFLLIMIYVTYLAYKRNQIQRYGLVFWIGLWILGIILVLFHSFFNKIILNSLNVARLFDLYTILGFLGVLFIVFYLFKATQRLEGKIEVLTRNLALKPIKEMKKGR